MNAGVVVDLKTRVPTDLTTAWAHSPSGSTLGASNCSRVTEYLPVLRFLLNVPGGDDIFESGLRRCSGRHTRLLIVAGLVRLARGVGQHHRYLAVLC